MRRTDPDVSGSVVNFRRAVVVHKVLAGPFSKLLSRVELCCLGVTLGVETLLADRDHVVGVNLLGVGGHFFHPSLHVGGSLWCAAGIRSAGIATAPHLIH